MNSKDYHYIYGPVSSWRLGRSLGVDPVSAEQKICSFNCVYCQLGKTTALSAERRVFVPTKEVIAEIKKMPLSTIDYITFSGAGEPTLAKNLGDMIRATRKIRREKIAVITNSSLMNRKDVQTELASADFVLAKLDAGSETMLQKMNAPVPGINLRTIVGTIKGFRSFYKGKLALQIMFTPINEEEAPQIAQLAKEIRPNQIEINTPLRPCGVSPLPQSKLSQIEQQFRKICGDKISITNVYTAEKKSVTPISRPDTLRRRGKY